MQPISPEGPTVVQADRSLKVIRMAQQIHGTLDLEAILERFLQLSVQELDTEGGTIYFLDPATRMLESRHVISTVAVEQFSLGLGQGIAGQVAASGEPVITEDTTREQRFSDTIDRLHGYHTRNQICFPLKDKHGQVIGVLQLVNKRSATFNGDDVAFLQDISIFVAMAIKNAQYHRDSLVKARMEREILLARGIQEKILPTGPPAVAGFEIFADFRSCYETAGDYYQFFRTSGSDTLLLFDVSGKGVAAAMVAFSIHTFLDLELAGEPDLSSLLSRLNAFMLKNFEGEKYATGAIVRLLSGGGAEYLSAGHTPLLHFGSEGHTLLTPTALPVGLLPDMAYASSPLSLAPGDLLCVYSDGYNETQNPQEEEFGVERLVDCLQRNKGLPLPEIHGRLNAEMSKFQGTAKDYDDRSMTRLRKS